MSKKTGAKGQVHAQPTQRQESGLQEASQPSRPVLPPDFPFKVPAILLEGDEPAPVVKRKSAPESRSRAGEDSLIEKVFARYGTTLHLAAREPRCLYASWDLTDEEQRTFNARSADNHLVLRAHREQPAGPVAAEAHVHPDSQHWFLHVDFPAATYVAELGYYAPDKHWVSLAVSQPVTTPPDRAGEVSTGAGKFVHVTFTASLPTATAALVPAESGAASRVTLPGDGMPQAVQGTAAAGGSPPFTEAPLPPPPPVSAGDMHQATLTRPGTSPARPAEWAPSPGLDLVPTPSARLQVMPAPAPPLSQSEEVVWETIRETVWQREHKSSAEMAEYFQRIGEFLRVSGQAGQVQELPSSAAPAWEAAPPAEVSSITLAEAPTPGSAPVTPAGAPRNFWFNVNAELVIYGATEPDATVTIGNRKIRLRPDGSFSYRFALPDGEFKLPVVAVAAHGDERGVQLRFARVTDRSGEVGAHPQDQSLKPPAPENIP